MKPLTQPTKNQVLQGTSSSIRGRVGMGFERDAEDQALLLTALLRWGSPTAAIELLTGLPAGIASNAGNYPRGSVLGHAQKTLLAYRRACQEAETPRTVRKHLRK